jgi:hypothetical protein
MTKWADRGADRYQPFDGALMLRLDVTTPDGAATYYVTPFVTDGARLFLFDEPGERSDALDALLLGNPVEVSCRSTGELSVSDTGRRPSPDEERWARDACSARFFYDQALQDIALLGTVVVLGPQR